MTVLVANSQFNMATYFSSGDLQGLFEWADVLVHTGSTFQIKDVEDTQEVLTLTGTFGGYTPDFYPTTGTVTGGSYSPGNTGFSSFSFSGASISVAAFTNYVNSNDIEGLFAQLLQGADLITGSASNDVLFGFAGADILDGGLGADSLYGGTGNDTYKVNLSADIVSELTGEGNDTIESSATYVLGANVENLTLTGSGAINGTGNSSANTIVGNAGVNVLNGAAGTDILTGGLGEDVFQSTAAGLSGDTITDFVAGDRIVISNATLAGFSYALSGNTLTYSGGSLTLQGFSGSLIVSAAVGGGVQLIAGALNIEPLRIEANSQAFELANDGLSASGTGTITVGRTDGRFPMLTAGAGGGQYTATTASITASAFTANVGGISESLWGGSLVIDVATQRGTITETVDGTFTLAGLDVTFKKVSILEDSLGFDVVFELPDILSGALIDAQAFDVDLVFDANGVRLAPQFTVSVPDISFNLFGTIPAEISDLRLEYDGVENVLYLRSLIELGEIVNDQGTTIQADFTGDNFIRYGPEGLDAVIEFDITTDIEFAGWGLENLQVSLDTVAKEATGEATISTPFGVQLGNGVDITVGIGITYDPFHLNSVTIEADNLNRPLPGLLLYNLQSIGGSIQNLAPTSTEPVVFSGTMGGTYGPQYQGNSLARLDLTGTISSDQMTGMAELTVAKVVFDGLGGRFSGAYSVLDATGTGVLNWTNGTFSVDGSLNILEGLFTVTSSLDIDSNWNVSLSQQMALAIPDWVPVFSGALVSDGNLALRFINDGNFTNDYVMVWGHVEISKMILGNPFVIDLTTGIRFGFDGSVSLVGVDDIPDGVGAEGPKSPEIDQDSIGDADAGSASASVGSGEAYILLAASWTNSVSDAQLVITLPDGIVIQESEFEQHGIAIIEEFSNGLSRVAVAFEPTAGSWSVTAHSSSTLEGLQTSILEEATQASLSIDSITAATASEVSIAFEAIDPDSDAEISFWYSTSAHASGGTLIGTAAETDSTGAIIWDTAGVAPGQYFVYAVINDGQSAPIEVLSDNRIVIAEGQPPAILPADTVRNDFTGDGRSDILWRHDSGVVIQWVGQNDGSFAWDEAISYALPTDWMLAASGDFNGDGRNDIVWRHESGSTIEWLGQADGTLSYNAAAGGNLGLNWQVSGTADFNGDNRTDILWRNEAGVTQTWLAEANGSFVTSAASYAMPTDWTLAAAADFTGDDRADILWRHDSGVVIQWVGQADGSFAWDENISYALPTAWTLAAAGDFDADGRNDLIWRHESGNIIEWLGQADGSFLYNATANAVLATNWQVTGVGDFNGDHRDDVLWRSDTGILATWLGQDDGSFAPSAATYAMPTDWSVQPENPWI